MRGHHRPTLVQLHYVKTRSPPAPTARSLSPAMPSTGMARMFQALSPRGDDHLLLTRDLDEARRWLGVE